MNINILSEPTQLKHHCQPSGEPETYCGRPATSLAYVKTITSLDQIKGGYYCGQCIAWARLDLDSEQDEMTDMERA